MIPETPFDHLIPLFQDPSFRAIRDCKARQPGRPVVGTFPVWVPVEIIEAAGAWPVAILGGGTLVDIQHADARLQSFICSIARSTLELGLRGILDFLDGMVFPSICDVARNLSGVWARNFPRQKVVYLHLPENVSSPHAVRFMRAELLRLQREMEGLTDHRTQPEDLRAAIRRWNENRRLIRTLYRIKQDEPHRLSTYETWILMRAGAVLTVDGHNRILRDALVQVRERVAHPKDRIRVVLEGSFCEQPPLEFIWAIEEAGCYILDDDFLLGNRYLAVDVAEEGDPLENLARAYLTWARPSAIRYDGPAERAQAFVQRVRSLQVDGVIFAYAKFCDPAQFDFVILKEHLERAGIPYITLEFEEKMTVFETVRNQVETFVESILFYT